MKWKIVLYIHHLYLTLLVILHSELVAFFHSFSLSTVLTTVGGCLLTMAEPFLSSENVMESYLPSSFSLQSFQFEKCSGSNCFQYSSNGEDKLLAKTWNYSLLIEPFDCITLIMINKKVSFYSARYHQLLWRSFSNQSFWKCWIWIHSRETM